MNEKLKILIVEDELISRTLLREMLSAYGICHVATNGKEALDVIEKSYDSPEGKFDLVCLDIMMPEMNGHEVLQKVRIIEKDLRLKGQEMTKIFMTTALSDTKNIMEAFTKGRCEAYITKPINRKKLETHLQEFHLL